MSREGKLAKNTFVLALGKICTQLITFFLLPLYTSILSVEEFGIVDLLNTLVSLMLPIVTFQVEQAVFRELIDCRENNERKKKIISTGFFPVFIQCMVYLAVFFIISPFITNRYKYFLATNVIAFIFASLFQQGARGMGDNNKYAFSGLISAVITIITNVLLLVVVKLGATGMLLGNMLGQIACIIYIFVALKLYKYLSISEFKAEILKKLWKYSIPLVPNGISWWVFNASDRIIVSAILGVAQNGILSAAHKFSNVYYMIFQIFNMTCTETIAVHILDKDIKDFFNNIFNTILKIFVAISIFIIACMPIVYPIMINRNYFIGYYQVPIMMIASIFNVIIGLIGTIYVANKNTKAIANTSLFSAIINIIVHLLLINFVGLFAATISTFVAYLIMTIYRISDVNKRYFKIVMDEKFIIRTFLVLVVILLIYYLGNIYIQMFGILFVMIYALRENRNCIKVVLNILKRKIKLKNV